MIFLQYLRQRLRSILVWVLIVIIFLTTFFLYELPLEAVAYPALLSGFFALIFCVIDFILFIIKHKNLQRIKEQININAAGLPVPKNNVIEQDYQEIIKALFAENVRISNDSQEKFVERNEYYTAWVHQIKTPIAAMRLVLENPENTSQYNSTLAKELRQIEQYVDMVLTYLRLESDSTDYIFNEYELDDIVKSSVRQLAPIFINRKITLDYQPLGCTVLTDKKWLSFVIEQVLTNSLKYTRSGGTISITLEAPKTLCITDNGIGIAPEDLHRIFENGYTGYNGRSNKKSTGIGLYLCRRIINRLGHRIFAFSTPESGTVIKINLKKDKMIVE